jgi:hypothetical protein
MLGGGSPAASLQRNASVLSMNSSEATPVTPVDHLEDENGNIIQRPVEPNLKIILSELEMKPLVMTGSETLRQTKYNFRDDYDKLVAEGIEKILVYCGDTVRWRWEPLLMLNAEAAAKSTGTRTRSSSRASTSSPSVKGEDKHEDGVKKKKSKKKV